MLGLKQQDLYHLESNLCQLCLQVKRSNLTARVSTWGCGHVQGELTALEFVWYLYVQNVLNVCVSVLGRALGHNGAVQV